MQAIVAGLMALTAMGASILADVDPMTTVTRGGVAFFAGLLFAGIWGSVVNPKQPKAKPEKPAKQPKQPKPKPAEVESEAEPEEDTEEAA